MILPTVLYRICGKFLSLLRSRMNRTKNKSSQQQMQKISSYIVSVPSVELQGGTKIDGRIACQYFTNKVKDYKLSPSAVTALMFPVTLVSSLEDQLKNQVNDLTMQLDNVYLSEANKCATKIVLPCRRSSLFGRKGN